ncbi:MAG: glycosyltransferase, partial [Synechocystis sp.]|nr:glycosyltransferase [Synechocystis sp.]
MVVWLMAGGIGAGFSQSFGALAIAAGGLVVSVLIRPWLREYYPIVPGLLTAISLTVGAGIGWSGCFLMALSLSTLTRILMVVNAGLSWLTVIAGLITVLPAQAFLLRKIWHRPRTAPPVQPRSTYPKVSVHVPCYAEPPAVVCATLAAIAEVDYPDFEVLLIDNNTADPDLWQPVQAYCEELNRLMEHNRFRFFHVEKLAGAKAGALNFALRHTDPDASLIAVVDADYQITPDFLTRLVGFFDDPGIGFVQTPHDYRHWQGNHYLRGCYWEYMSFFRLQLAGLNEWIASYIIGTMCIIRKTAVEKAGGWAEWCLTEDSELAVRIHGAGYRSLFLTESFGRGLIPETFQDYKKQRLRWTMGPIQQLQRHWRLYLPKPWAAPSQLTPWQKCLELSHSLGGLFPLLLLIFIPLNLAAIASLQIHQNTIPLPPILWFGAAMTAISGLMTAWLTYWLLGCRCWQDMGLALLATLSLQHIRFVGAFQAVFGRSPQWKRTNKFQVFP